MYNKTAAQSISRDTSYLESRYDVRVEDSKDYRQYKRQYPMWDIKGSVDYLEPQLEVVPMKALHLTREALDKLEHDLALADRYVEDAEYGKRIVSQLRADERVRDDNPAVAKAYRNYITLLELARK